MFRFHKVYFILTVILFLAEVLIAVYVNDSIIRPYVGDFLVVILIYCFLMSFLKVPYTQLAIVTLLFAYFIEALQYFNLIGLLGLQGSKPARAVLGNSFEWIDIFVYTLGIMFVLSMEKLRPWHCQE